MSDEAFNVGDHCETTSVVTLRAEEAPDSEVTSEMPIGAQLEIIEVSACQRCAKVRAGSKMGWVSLKSRLKAALVRKRLRACNDFDVGGHYELISVMTLRARESLESEVVAELNPGDCIKILRFGSVNKRRVKVETEFATGWISSIMRQGEPLIRSRPVLQLFAQLTEIGNILIEVTTLPGNVSKITLTAEDTLLTLRAALNPALAKAILVSGSGILNDSGNTPILNTKLAKGTVLEEQMAEKQALAKNAKGSNRPTFPPDSRM